MTEKEINAQALALEMEYKSGKQDSGLHSIGKMDFEHAVKAIKERRNRKPYTFRLPIATVEALKRKAGRRGVPYQTFVCALLEDAAK